jgi:hypothetical protein
MLGRASSLACAKANVVTSLVFRRLGRALVRFSVVCSTVALDSFDGTLEGVSIVLGIFFGGLGGLEDECLR